LHIAKASSWALVGSLVEDLDKDSKEDGHEIIHKPRPLFLRSRGVLLHGNANRGGYRDFSSEKLSLRLVLGKIGSWGVSLLAFVLYISRSLSVHTNY
jgi:hypothetical protein